MKTQPETTGCQKGLEIVQKRDENSLSRYTEGDWGNCIIDRRLYTVYTHTFRWCHSLPVETTENCSAFFDGGRIHEIRWSRERSSFAEKINVRNRNKGIKWPIIYNDSQGILKLAKNPLCHVRSKYVDIRHTLHVYSMKEMNINRVYTYNNDSSRDTYARFVRKQIKNMC